jgi:type I restriction enzyme S subunit
VTLQRGQDLRRSEFAEGEIPVIGATQIIGYHDAANVKGPGVTVVRSGSSAGFAQFVKCDFWAHNVVLYVKDFHGNDPKYVSYQLNHIDLSRFRAGVAVPTLNRNTFASLTTGVPSLDEQFEIAHILSTIDEKIAVHESKKSALHDLFKTTLNKLMTGAVRVADLDIETAGVEAA